MAVIRPAITEMPSQILQNTISVGFSFKLIPGDELKDSNLKIQCNSVPHKKSERARTGKVII